MDDIFNKYGELYDEEDDDYDYKEEELTLRDAYLHLDIEEAEGIQLITTFDTNGSISDVKINVHGGNKCEEEKPLCRYIDSTILKADATPERIVDLCHEARANHFAAVCVNSAWVRLASELLRGSDVAVCTVVGFPLGAMATEAKAFEAGFSIENGATEIDMVINIGALKAKDYKMVAKDIHSVMEVCHQSGAKLKVILETCLLTKEEKIIACLLSKAMGADFVKTSTGFSTAGATLEDIELMRRIVGPDMGVKASGGVRDKETAMALIKAGATRIGTSSGVAIVKG